MPGIYLEPVGLLYGIVAKDAVALGAALPLAGGPIAFSAVRLWEGEPGNVKHAIVRTSTIQAIDEPRVKDVLERLVAPRAPIAGVSMDGPRLMGVVNVTPDSFSDGGDFLDTGAAVSRALECAAEGADFLDIGGEFHSARLNAGAGRGRAAPLAARAPRPRGTPRTGFSRHPEAGSHARGGSSWGKIDQRCFGFEIRRG